MAERDWREASDLRPSRAGLAVVVAAAAILRFWELGRGVPHAIGTEEPEIVDRAFQMMKAGTLNPEFFDYGQFHILLQLGVSIARFVLGSMAGEWYALSGATSHPFYPWGRALVAGAGVLTVLLVFRIGMRWGARHALLGSALLATLPFHVRYSQLVVPDVLLTFLATLTLSLSLTATDRRTWSAFALAGFTAGLAAATRYTGVVAIVMPLAACWMTTALRPNRLVGAAAAMVACGAGFLVAAPYTVLALPAFLERFAALAAAARTAAVSGTAGAATILPALQVQFVGPDPSAWLPALAWPVMILLGIGAVIGTVKIVRGPGRTHWVLAFAFLACHLWLMLALGIGDPRHLLPVMPILCLVTAVGVISGVRALRRFELTRGLRTAMIAGLTVAALAPGAVASVRYVRDRSKPSTEDLAYQWVRQNIPRTAVVVVEASAMSIPRGVVLGRGMGELRMKTYDDFAREGVNYLIASSSAYARYLSAPATYREEYLAYTRLFSEAREVARFSPSPDHPGPELRVLQILP